MVHPLAPPDAAKQVVNDFWVGLRSGNLSNIVDRTRDEKSYENSVRLLIPFLSILWMVIPKRMLLNVSPLSPLSTRERHAQ
jgi:hypothetical protein